MVASTLYVVKKMVLAPAAWRAMHPTDLFAFVPNQVISNLSQVVDRGCASNSDEASRVMRSWIKDGVVIVADESTMQFARALRPANAPAELGVSPERTEGKKAPYGPNDPMVRQEDLLAHHNNPNQPFGYDRKMLAEKSDDDLREMLRDAAPGVSDIDKMPRTQLIDCLSYDHANHGDGFAAPLGENELPKT